MENFKYHVKLDNFEKHIGELEKKFKRLESVMEEAFEEIGDLVYKRLLDNILAYGLGDSEIYATARIIRHADGFEVSVGAESAFFVEFGTGVVGKTNPHPSFVGKWMYDTNNRGEQGWFYPTSESDPNPYKHYFNGILYGWTKGSPSKPYMYKTWLYGTKVINPVVNKHIRRALK